jgi:hypothetical protein
MKRALSGEPGQPIRGIDEAHLPIGGEQPVGTGRREFVEQRRSSILRLRRLLRIAGGHDLSLRRDRRNERNDFCSGDPRA